MNIFIVLLLCHQFVTGFSSSFFLNVRLCFNYRSGSARSLSSSQRRLTRNAPRMSSPRKSLMGITSGWITLTLTNLSCASWVEWTRRWNWMTRSWTDSELMMSLLHAHPFLRKNSSSQRVRARERARERREREREIILYPLMIDTTTLQYNDFHFSLKRIYIYQPPTTTARACTLWPQLRTERASLYTFLYIYIYLHCF